MAARSVTDARPRARWWRALVLACMAGGFAPAAHAGAVDAVAAGSWLGLRSAHLEVLTDADRESAEALAVRLEDLRLVLSLAAPALVADAAPVQVIVFRDPDLAAQYAPRWNGARDRVSGFFQSAPDRGRLLFAASRAPVPTVAQHEYIHALLDAAMPGVPLWLNEGLAEYFSTFTAAGDRAEAGAPVPAHLEWLADHDLMPIGELFAITQRSNAYHEGDRRGTFYAQAWLLTHMILSGREAGSAGDSDLHRLERTLIAVRDGEPFPRAFTREFGSEAALAARLAAYVEQKRYVVREWRLSRPLAARATQLRSRVSASEVLGSLAIALLARATPERELAEAHAQRAVSGGANDPGGCAALGWLALLRGQRAEARNWFDRALEREPLSVSAVKVLAAQMLHDAGARDDGAERESVAAFVRAPLERARRLAPEDPEIAMLLARTWVVAPGADASPGQPWADAALAAMPGRPDVQLDHLALAALTGHMTEAQEAFARWFRDSDDPELRRNARRALFVGAVHEANADLQRSDHAAAEARLRAARERVADDPAIAAEADRILAQLARTRTDNAAESARVDRENAAITHYNAGVGAAESQRWAVAAAEFRKAAAGSARETFRRDALRQALRMDLRVRAERAFALARGGDVAGALAVFQRMDRAAMTPEDRRWYDDNVARLQRARGR